MTTPAIAAPTLTADPFAPIDQGGLGLASVTPPGPFGFAAVPAAPPQVVQEQPGFFDRSYNRIGDNFAAAFQAPLGPGAWYEQWTAPSGYGALDAVS